MTIITSTIGAFICTAYLLIWLSSGERGSLVEARKRASSGLSKFKFQQSMAVEAISPWYDSIKDVFYVADFDNNAVKLIDSSDRVKVLDIVSEVPLSGPFGVSGPGGGMFYLTELTGNRVSYASERGDVLHVSVIAGSRSGECGMSGDGYSPLLALLCKPRGLFYHQHRNALYIADSGNYRIRVINLSDMYIDSFSGFVSPSEFDNTVNLLPQMTNYEPADVFIDSADDVLYFLDYGKGAVYYGNVDSERFESKITYSMSEQDERSNAS